MKEPRNLEIRQRFWEGKLVCPACHMHWPRQRRTGNVYEHRSCGTTLVWKEA